MGSMAAKRGRVPELGYPRKTAMGPSHLGFAGAKSTKMGLSREPSCALAVEEVVEEGVGKGNRQLASPYAKRT